MLPLFFNYYFLFEVQSYCTKYFYDFKSGVYSHMPQFLSSIDLINTILLNSSNITATMFNKFILMKIDLSSEFFYWVKNIKFNIYIELLSYIL